MKVNIFTTKKGDRFYTTDLSFEPEHFVKVECVEMSKKEFNGIPASQGAVDYFQLNSKQTEK